MNQLYLKFPFASAGDVATVPMNTQTDGTVSFQQGWGYDYERDMDADPADPLAKPIERNKTNYLMNVITSILKQLQEVGFPEWITPTDNGGVAFSYAKYAQVMYNGIGYFSNVAGNVSVPGTSGNTDWVIIPISAPAPVVTVPSGQVSMFAMASAPAGWLPANGQLVSRTTYSGLYAAIGVLYGAGDGSTTFQLPDLRGEFLRGWDNGRGVDSGRGMGTTQGSANMNHNHTGSLGYAGEHSHTYVDTDTNPSGGVNGLAGGTAYTDRETTNYTSSAGNHTHTIYLDASGGIESRPRNIAMLVCIKT